MCTRICDYILGGELSLEMCTSTGGAQSASSLAEMKSSSYVDTATGGGALAPESIGYDAEPLLSGAPK
jgi:hypothetical protein